MEKLGYTNYYQVLNAKDYGVPQNRERVFTVSVRETISKATFLPSGETIDHPEKFEFPPKRPLTKRLKDVLEPEVDEKYYISSAMMDYFMGVNQKPSKFPRRERFLANINRKDQDRANSITTNPGQRPTDNFIVASRGRNPDNPSDRTTGSPTAQRLEPRFDGCTNTLTSVQKDNYVVIKTANNSQGVVELNKTPKHQQDLIQHENGLCRTIPAGTHGSTPHLLKTATGDYRIRKLTPKECWRLMGFDDTDFEKAQKVNSNTQLYKQAGNSIVVNVLEHLLTNLLKGEL